MLKPIIILLHLICYCYTVQSKRDKEQAYSDVLKNITLANKLIQDLIKNYDRLENIHQSEELLQMHSLSTETDQIFKSSSGNKPKTKQRDRSNKKYTRRPFIGTAMIYESLSDENVAEESNEETKEDEKNQRPVQTNPYNFIGEKISSEDLKTRFHIVNNKSKNKKSVPNRSVSKSGSKSKESSEDGESEEVEQIIIDIPEEVSGVVLNTPNEKIIKSYSKDKPITNIWGTKTRFSIQHSANRKEKRNLPRDGYLGRDALRIRNDSRGIKKPNWSRIISLNKLRKNKIKPARLRKHREEISQMNNKSKTNNKEKIMLLILNNNETAKYDWNKELQDRKIKNKQVFPNTDLKNDIFLRSEYGDTCLQMPIKKCKKALRKVNKNICKRRFKCKSDFKSDFTQNSKDGCNEEFAYKEKPADKSAENETKSEKHEKFSPPEFRELKKKSLKNNRREKQGSVKVLPKYKLQQLNHFVSLRNETPLGAFLRRKRDRYEKKCQKESRLKCNNACSYALKETCSIHNCEKRRKKAIKSECKTQCKIAYKDTKERVKSSSKSDSDSDSDSDSESDSESDSA